MNVNRKFKGFNLNWITFEFSIVFIIQILALIAGLSFVHNIFCNTFFDGIIFGINFFGRLFVCFLAVLIGHRLQIFFVFLFNWIVLHASYRHTNVLICAKFMTCPIAGIFTDFSGKSKGLVWEWRCPVIAPGTQVFKCSRMIAHTWWQARKARRSNGIFFNSPGCFEHHFLLEILTQQICHLQKFCIRR